MFSTLLDRACNLFCEPELNCRLLRPRIWQDIKFCCLIETLPDDLILSTLKALEGQKVNVTRMWPEFFHERIENIVGEKEMTGYQHYLLSPQYHHESARLSLLNTRLCGKGLSELLLCCICSVYPWTPFSNFKYFCDKYRTKISLQKTFSLI